MQKCTYNPNMSYSINFVLCLLLALSIFYLIYVKKSWKFSGKCLEFKFNNL